MSAYPTTSGLLNDPEPWPAKVERLSREEQQKIAMVKRRIVKPPRQKTNPDYRQLWRIVDGAVYDTIVHHPEYFTEAGAKYARMSIAKRATGAIHGYAVQAAWGRSGQRSGD